MAACCSRGLGVGQPVPLRQATPGIVQGCNTVWPTRALARKEHAPRPPRFLELAATARSRAAAVAAAAGAPAAHATIAAFLDAFNQRDVGSMLRCLSDTAVYHNLNYPDAFVGKQAVESVLKSLVSGAPADWQLLMDDATGDSAAMAVVFHMVDGGGRTVPLSHGIAFYRLDQAGQICRIWEASEQVFKVPQAVLPAVGAAAPLLQALGGNPLGSLIPGMQAAAATATPAPPLFAAALGASAASPMASSRMTLGRQATGATPSAAAPQRQAAAPPAAVAAAGSTSPNASSSSGGGSSGGSGSISELCGVWIKDLTASDMASYGRACDLMQLGGLQKTTAMQLIEGVEIEQRGPEVAVRFLTVVPFFKVTEPYRLDGPASMTRRDLRGGGQQATTSVAPDGSLQVAISWGEPNAGGIQEQYRLAQDGSLECLSTVQVAAGTETTRVVYRRSDKWRPRYSWNPLWGGP